MSKFYTYCQNNSGGYDVKDDAAGIGSVVIIEAQNAYEANARFENIGLNVSGFNDFCDCCGERWSNCDDKYDGDNVPTLYGEAVDDIEKPWRDEVFVHYLNGKIVKHSFPQKD